MVGGMHRTAGQGVIPEATNVVEIMPGGFPSINRSPFGLTRMIRAIHGISPSLTLPS